jgi:hypothetical protein
MEGETKQSASATGSTRAWVGGCGSLGCGSEESNNNNFEMWQVILNLYF